jgi:hypothetical protein
MKAWPAIGFLSILAGCVTDETAQRAALAVYNDCTMAAVRRLDDSRSDPASVAMGVAGACSGQYQQLSLQMQGQMLTDNGQAYMRDQMRTNELRLATDTVLTYRASQRPR